MFFSLLVFFIVMKLKFNFYEELKLEQSLQLFMNILYQSYNLLKFVSDEKSCIEIFLISLISC
jgi:hypothetical protein